ncbi:MAG: OmpA family protein [Gemmatimonadetes bacterium]|uniref:OmpA family protein n=1 Tax=Candidatus Kutchimonas denitrificans TaxID=3056748 RepID=A0AAE5C9Y6_9BACT|nr:OmpA family protein [Gemmatimonadota bacterium]NIR75976.1 OmpA family protein [Candidatus Kutchimonas denitrificans]NIS02168.1 OmpA family protein [Gemmatimonadota bacterium]NIT67994.1 OmpA family protein [Gemmatimonadota bacterium]NIU54020.1 OmpA family protein [Gemmatimonadota bacterium]
MQRVTSFITVVVLAVALTVGTQACATKKQTGALVGAGAGAAVGGAVGAAAGNTVVGAIIGAAVGGAAGLIIGDYMDRQAAEIERDLEGATVTRVGEGIRITFGSGILFDVDKADLRPVAQQELVDLAKILNKYPDTIVLVEGHTDSTGPEAYNMELSERRAQSVAHYLATQNVTPSRFSTVGYGEVQPIASNETAAGRQQNRRVELAIMANEKLKEAARRQAEGD